METRAVDLIHRPTDLDVSAESKEEILLTIVGEIIAVFRGEAAESLKYKIGPIHERI